jgi:hypothetical protein
MRLQVWENGPRGVIRASSGGTIEDTFSMEDWVPTLMAAVGEPGIKEKLKKGHQANGNTFKVYLDGYDQLDLLMDRGPGKRQEIFYFDDTGSLNAVRVRDWKIHFTIMEDWIKGGRRSGWPVPINLRRDPFERNFEESPMWFRWSADKLWTFVPIQAFVSRFLATFKEFPQRQESASFNIDNVLEQMQRARQQGS